MGPSAIGQALGCLVKLGVVGAALIGGLIYLGSLAPKPPPGANQAGQGTAAKPAGFAALPGAEAIIDIPGNTRVWLAADEESWNPMLDAQNRQDTEELALLIAKGKVLQEANGVRVKVIQGGFTSRKVRIRDGENPGAEGWIQAEFLKPAPPGG